MTSHSASRPQSQILAARPELGCSGKLDCAKGVAIKAKLFSFLKQILNPGHFLWKIESHDLNCMKFLWFHLYKILFTNKWLTKIDYFSVLTCNDRMTIASLIEMERSPIFNADSSNFLTKYSFNCTSYFYGKLNS